jgi:hypothetical protein
MAIQLLRGHVKDLTSRDKHGAVDCQTGKSNIKVHGDLVSSIAKGDDVLFACEHRNNVYHALALKNIDRGKTAQVDLTNSILLMVASGFLCILGFGLDLDFDNIGVIGQSIDMTVGFIGLLGMGITLRRLFLIARARNWVHQTDF